MKRTSITTTLVSLGMVMRTFPTLAAEAEGRAGLPQMDVSFYPSQIFWLVISFAILYVLMSKVALPGVKHTQDCRKDIVDGEIAGASRAGDEAKAMVAQYEKALVDARAKAQATMSEITAKAAKEAAEKQAAQQAELMKRLQQAEASIRTARDKAVAEVSASASDLAQAICHKVAS